MKKIIKIFPAITLALLTILVIFLYDWKEKNEYTMFYDYQSLDIKIPENQENIDYDKLDKLFELVEKEGAFLEKQVASKENNGIRVYCTVDDWTAIFSDRFLTMYENGDKDGFVATYKTSDSKQAGYLADFLENSRYEFHKMKDMRAAGVYPLDIYRFHYKTDAQLEAFFEGSEEILGVPRDNLVAKFAGRISEHTELVEYGMTGAIAIFILFYFLLIIFQLYHNSKKIGCLFLMGFKNNDVIRVLFSDNLKISIILSVISFILCAFLLPNAKPVFIITLGLVYILLNIIQILICKIGLRIIQGHVSISGLLKKHSLLDKIGKMCLVAKCIAVGGILVFVILFIPIIQETVNSVGAMKNNQILLDYAVFPRIAVSNSESKDYERYLELFKGLEENSDDVMYVKFGNYLETDPEAVKNYEEMEKNGTKFRMATVDKNYLLKYGVSPYDESGNTVELDMKKTYYLLPISRQSHKEKLYEEINAQYAKRDINETVEVYFYDDKEFDTFDALYGITSVKSPNFRVIGTDFPYTYMENHLGIDVAGTGMNTGLKFKIEDSPAFYEDSLLPYIKNAGLQDVLKKENFVSYSDYYNTEMLKLQKTNRIFYGGSIAIILIYIWLVIQTFVLFSEANRDEIFVKQLMGIGNRDIFMSITIWNIGASLTAIFGAMTFLIVGASEHMTLGILACLGIIIFELLLISVIVSRIRFSKIYENLKGK